MKPMFFYFCVAMVHLKITTNHLHSPQMPPTRSLAALQAVAQMTRVRSGVWRQHHDVSRYTA